MSKKNIASNALIYIFTLIRGTFATKSEVPTKVSDLTNDSGFVTTDTNTTYTLTQDASDGHKFTLTGSDGSTKTITIPDNDTTVTLSSLGIGNVKNYDQSKAIKSITRSGTTFTFTCLDNTTGTFDQQDNNTWTAMTGATSSANGTAGYVPAPPKDGYNTKYLRADGSWAVPPDNNTTYSDVVAGGSSGLMSGSDKTKLDGIATGANKTTVDSSLSSSSTNPVQNKVVNSALANKAPLASPQLTGTPTAPTASAGTSGTQIATCGFVGNAITNAIAGVTQIDIQIVSSLPAAGTKGVIYFVSNGSSESGNTYDEYVWIPANTAYEKVGSASIDLSGYLLEADLVELTNAEIDTAWAASASA